MRSVLEEEIRGRLSGFAFRLRRYDIGVVLSVALCFTPLPPAMLVGLVLSGCHLTLARNKLSSQELSLLFIAIVVASGYIVAWTIAIDWLARTGQLHAWLDLIRDWLSRLARTFEPDFLRRSVVPPSSVQHA